MIAFFFEFCSVRHGHNNRLHDDGARLVRLFRRIVIRAVDDVRQELDAGSRRVRHGWCADRRTRWDRGAASAGTGDHGQGIIDTLCFT